MRERDNDLRNDDLRNDDLRAASQFFAERLRGADLDEPQPGESDEPQPGESDETQPPAEGLIDARLLRWTRHKLRNDMQAVAELMLIVGYRPTFIRYFLRYHIPALNERAAVGETYIDPDAAPDAHLGLCWRLDNDVLTVVSDLHRAAKRLRQPYRDLAAVCLKWGYVHETVVRLLAKTLERKAKNVVED